MSEKSQEPENWIEIARVGRFKDSGGAEHDFSPARLEKIAASYDPQKREAPLVIGHPAVNGPACGWVRRLKTRGEKLLAHVACVTDEVKAAVDNGFYRYVSMSLYPDDGLRHVGLLGGTPPAIDGLAPAAFSADAALTVDFNSPEQTEQKGNQMDIEALMKLNAELQNKVAALTQERDAAVKEAAGLKEQLAASQTGAEQTAAEFAAFRDQKEKEVLSGRIDRLVTAGKLTPAERPAVEKVAETLRRGAANFAGGQEGENPLETYFGSLEKRPASPLMSSFSAPAPPAADDQPEHKPLSAKL